MSVPRASLGSGRMWLVLDERPRGAWALRRARERAVRFRRWERMQRQAAKRERQRARVTERALSAAAAAGEVCACQVEPGMTVQDLDVLAPCVPDCQVLERVRRRLRGLGGGA